MCSKRKIKGLIYSLNFKSLMLTAKVLNINVKLLQSFLIDERNISYRDSNSYKKFTNFRKIYTSLVQELTKYDKDFFNYNIENDIKDCDVCLITDLSSIYQYNYLLKHDPDIFVANISKMKFCVKNSRLINNLEDFDKFLNEIFNRGVVLNYEC
jgi:hypothetical protein